MNFNLVTIFPEITKLLEFGVIGKAIEKDLISINSLNPRDFSKNINKNVDDEPSVSYTHLTLPTICSV